MGSNPVGASEFLIKLKNERSEISITIKKVCMTTDFQNKKMMEKSKGMTHSIFVCFDH